MILRGDGAREWLRKLGDKFRPHEFECRCGCGLLIIDTDMIDLLYSIRTELYRRPMIVTSGTRCQAHNEAIGGSPDSAHLTGHAVDIAVADSRERFSLVEDALVMFDRVGVAKDFVHMDTAPDKPRRVLWTY